MPATHSTSRPDLCRKRSVGQLRQRFQSTAMQEVSLDVWNMEICWFSIYVQSGQDQSRRQQRDALSCLNISTGTDAMCTTAIAGKGRKRPQKPGHPEGPATRTPAGERPAPPGAEAGPQGWLETALQQTKRRGTRGLGGAPRHGIAARSCPEHRATGSSLCNGSGREQEGKAAYKESRQGARRPSPGPTAATARPRASAPHPPPSPALPCRRLSPSRRRAASRFRSASGAGPSRVASAPPAAGTRSGPGRGAFPAPAGSAPRGGTGGGGCCPPVVGRGPRTHSGLGGVRSRPQFCASRKRRSVRSSVWERQHGATLLRCAASHRLP